MLLTYMFLMFTIKHHKKTHFDVNSPNLTRSTKEKQNDLNFLIKISALKCLLVT